MPTELTHKEMLIKELDRLGIDTHKLTAYDGTLVVDGLPPNIPNLWINFNPDGSFLLD